MPNKEKKLMYAIAEMCIIADDCGDKGIENDPEPVICRGIGLYNDETKADEKCKKCNDDYNGITLDDEDEQVDNAEPHFVVVPLNVRD